MFTELNIDGRRLGTYSISCLKSSDEVFTWVTNTHPTMSSGYWMKIRDFMLNSKPQLLFNVEDHISVDITLDDEPAFVNAMLENFAGKLKFKKYQDIVPWMVVLQEYLLDTDWKKKAQGKPKPKRAGRGVIVDAVPTFGQRYGIRANPPKPQARINRVVGPNNDIVVEAQRRAIDQWMGVADIQFHAPRFVNPQPQDLMAQEWRAAVDPGPNGVPPQEPNEGN